MTPPKHHFTNRLLLAVILLLPLCLSSCGYKESKGAHEGLSTVVGMEEEDLQACMGIPDKTLTLNPTTKLFEYVRTIRIPSANDSGFFPLQTSINLAENTLGGAGSTCIATIRIVNNHVTDMHYSGDNDHFVGTNGVCYSIVRGCLETPVKSGGKRASTLSFFNPGSTYHSHVKTYEEVQKEREEEQAKELQKQKSNGYNAIPTQTAAPPQKNIDVSPQKSNVNGTEL